MEENSIANFDGVAMAGLPPGPAIEHNMISFNWGQCNTYARLTQSS